MNEVDSKAKLSGEDIYASKFQFFDHVLKKDHEKLREYLYKTSFNLSDAYMYYDLLRFFDKFEKSDDPYDVPGSLFVMSVICFSVSLRKVIDRQSKSNLRKLVQFVCKEPAKQKMLKEIDRIYSCYKEFTDTRIVHQDTGKITRAAKVPDYDQNKKDLDSLAKMYNSIVSEICSSYIGIRATHTKNVVAFEKMLSQPKR